MDSSYLDSRQATLVPSTATVVGASAVKQGERQLPVFCPQCGHRIEVKKGLCGNRLIDAILLQAERIGTELECLRCRTRFVFQKLEELPVPKSNNRRRGAVVK